MSNKGWLTADNPSNLLLGTSQEKRGVCPKKECTREFSAALSVIKGWSNDGTYTQGIMPVEVQEELLTEKVRPKFVKMYSYIDVYTHTHSHICREQRMIR